jgi:hypothetical protein
MNIDTLYENFYKRKESADLINEVLDFLLTEKDTSGQAPGTARRERVLRLPIQFPTEISVGQKPDSEDREVFHTWMSRIAPEGTLKDKIKSIENFIKEPPTTNVADTLSYLMFLNSFSFMLQEFNASVAGFLWEPFLAALFGAESIQVPTSEGDIADVRLVIHRDGGLQRISLKILREKGPVGGSFSDLVDHFAQHPNEPMIYVVIKKFESDTLMKFYEFPVSQENFFEYIGHPDVVVKTDVREFTVPDDATITRREDLAAQLDNSDWMPEGWRVDRKSPKQAKIALAGEDKLIGTKGVAPGTTYDIYIRSIEKLPGKAGRGAKLRPNTKKLWGDDDLYAQWFELWDGGNNPGFWKAVQKSAPGYVDNEQFEISWTYASKLADNLGNLDISKEALDKAFARGSETIGTDLTEMFNALTRLVDNVGRFFMIDCGDPAGAEQQCTDRDAKDRSKSGREAVQDTGTLQRVVNEKIAKQLS